MSRSRVPKKSPQGQRIRRTQGHVPCHYGKAGTHQDKKRDADKNACRDFDPTEYDDLLPDYPPEWDEADSLPMPIDYTRR